MRGAWLACLMAGLMAASAAAQDESSCAVAAHLAYADYALSRVAAALKTGARLEILVMGSGSSTLPGPGGAEQAYPARLQAALTKRFPDVAIKVVSHAKSGRDTADMSRDLQKILKAQKPTLVVWQAGTVDAMRGVDPDSFQAALEKGVEALHGAGVDVILVNMQYSPRTESMIAIGTYADTMRVVAQQQETPLFDRFAIMKHWNELGTFDLLAATKSVDMAARVHDCIGQLLADVIVDGVKLSAPQPKVPQ